MDALGRSGCILSIVRKPEKIIETLDIEIITLIKE